MLAKRNGGTAFPERRTGGPVPKRPSRTRSGGWQRRSPGWPPRHRGSRHVQSAEEGDMPVKREFKPNFRRVKRLPGQCTKKETFIQDTKGHGAEPKGRIGGWSTTGSGREWHVPPYLFSAS